MCRQQKGEQSGLDGEGEPQAAKRHTKTVHPKQRDVIEWRRKNGVGEKKVN